MKTVVDLDDDLVSEVDKVVDLVKEKPATVLRMAIRAGLPLVAVRHQAPRPEGYFADAHPQPTDRRELEAAAAKTPQRPERLTSGNGKSGKLVPRALSATIGL